MLFRSAFSDAGTNPKSFARDTTFFLICAESKNISEAAMFVFTAPICEAYASKSIKTFTFYLNEE